MNASFSTGNIVENFLIGAAAGAVAAGVGYGLALAIGPTAGFMASVGKGALIGGVSSGVATTVNLLLKGEDITTKRNLGKIGLSIGVGAIVGGTVGAFSWNAPKSVAPIIEKGGQVQGELIDIGAQNTYDFIFDIKAIECAPFLKDSRSYQACMGN